MRAPDTLPSVRGKFLRYEPLENAAVLPRVIAEEAKAGDVVVLLGAGDITAWAYALPAQLEALV